MNMDGASPFVWIEVFWVFVVTPALWLAMIFWRRNWGYSYPEDPNSTYYDLVPYSRTHWGRPRKGSAYWLTDAGMKDPHNPTSHPPGQ